MAIVINGSGTVTGISVGGLPDGIVDAGTLAVSSRGTVLQVVNNESSLSTSSSTDTYVDTGLTASITPTSTSNKILVTICHGGCGKETGNVTLGFKVFRDSTDLGQKEGGLGYTGTTTGNLIGTWAWEYLDSPSTTSEVTYKTQFASGPGGWGTGSSAMIGWGAGRSTITLTEIAG